MRCVTSFSEEGAKQYGNRMLETYVEHVDAPIEVYVEFYDEISDQNIPTVSEKNLFVHDLITYRDLYRCPGAREFITQIEPFPAMKGYPWGEEERGRNYRIT